MIKAKTIDIADSNIANLGSQLEKDVRKGAAEKEPAWQEFEKKKAVPGITIWRIEKFKVVSWPKEEYGKFYDGDSYIIVSTFKKPGVEKIFWNIHFWLGKNTTQDEMGTAAYKTVELDDFLGTEPVQYREVQDCESKEFLKLFKQVEILSGGVDSGFNKVKPEEYVPRLLHLKGKRNIKVSQVECATDNLNEGDVFIYDAGLTIYQWNGKKAGIMEKSKAAALVRNLDAERRGRAQTKVVDQGDKDEQDMLSKLTPGTIKSAEEGGSDADWEKNQKAGATPRLMRVSDESGELKMTLVAEGADKINFKLFNSNDAMVLDSGTDIFVWIGKGASPTERKLGIVMGGKYQTEYKRPMGVSVSRVLEGNESNAFVEAMARFGGM